MKTVLSISTALFFVALSFAMEPAALAEEKRVGSISISGNLTVKNWDILKLVDMYPGQPLPAYRKLREVERRLLKKFRNQFGKGQFPRIEVEDSESQYHDIMIHFPEKKAKGNQ